VTIAMGLRANDGIVLCADSQQTVSGYIKIYDGKVDLSLFREPRVALAIAGAGTHDYIQTARQVILGDFPEELKKHKSIHLGIPIVLRERFLKFFDDHLSRWAYYQGRDRPTVELLIAVTGEGTHPRLFHCDGTAFHETNHKAIGVGVLLADQLLNQYVLGEYTVAQLGSLAVYVLRKVKNSVDGCGGETHVVALRKGFDFALTDHRDIKKMEQRFENLEKKRHESRS